MRARFSRCEATRAWNIHTALYYKAGGIPWRLVRDAAELTNNTGKTLDGGPITVYDNATYAGDTRILDLQPNEERLISYAVDLGTEVKAEGKAKEAEVKLEQALKLADELNYVPMPKNVVQPVELAWNDVRDLQGQPAWTGAAPVPH